MVSDAGSTRAARCLEVICTIDRMWIVKSSHNGYNIDMIRVGVRELKDRLSRYLRLVREGETIIVTDHNEVIAEIRSRSEEDTGERFQRYIEQLELAGRIIRPVDRAVSAEKIARMARRLGPVPSWRETLDDTRGG